MTETYTIIKLCCGEWSYKTETWRCGKSYRTEAAVRKVLRAEGWATAN
jgi:hypothetical protein